MFRIQHYFFYFFHDHIAIGKKKTNTNQMGYKISLFNLGYFHRSLTYKTQPKKQRRFCHGITSLKTLTTNLCEDTIIQDLRGVSNSVSHA
jgi:hypothetical protein